jgi:hypothetical protein
MLSFAQLTFPQVSGDFPDIRAFAVHQQVDPQQFGG